MSDYKNKVDETAGFLKHRIDTAPEVGIVTGTGLGDAAGLMEVSNVFEYEEIPHFPVSTVESHRGRLLLGRVEQKPAILMQGRFHLYEGYSPLEVTFPVRVMAALGVNTLILSNASGGLNPSYRPGDVAVITDHINLTGSNPLTGPNEAAWGERFPDMSRAYDRELLSLAAKAGQTLGLPFRKGVYAGLAGPSLETPAEVRFLRTIGADCVGFSTVQEVIAAVHSGMRVLGLSIITNSHDPDRPAPALTGEIIAVARKTVPLLEKLVKEILADRGFTP